eukprot:258341-Rhodomonas_salina.1
MRTSNACAVKSTTFPVQFVPGPRSFPFDLAVHVSPGLRIASAGAVTLSLSALMGSSVLYLQAARTRRGGRGREQESVRIWLSAAAAGGRKSCDVWKTSRFSWRNAG